MKVSIIDPVGSTVRYEMMKLYMYGVSIGHCEAVAVAVGVAVEGIYAFLYCTKWRSGQVSPMPY